MNQTIKKREVQNNYSRYYDCVLMATEVVNVKTGVVERLNSTDKLVYSYIAHHTDWFNSIGKSMFESQDSIGLALGLDRKTVGRSTKKLESLAMISRNKQKSVNGYMTIYFVPELNCGKFKLFIDEVIRERGKKDILNKIEIVVKNLPVESKQPSLQQPQKPATIQKSDEMPLPTSVPHWLDDDDCPF